jgi:hypothetical protein
MPLRAPPPPRFHAEQQQAGVDAQPPTHPNPSTTPPRPPLLRVRIATVEWSLAAPLHGIDVGASPLDGARLARVPVLRVWGPTSGGQRACVHVHKVSRWGERESEGKEEQRKKKRQLA